MQYLGYLFIYSLITVVSLMPFKLMYLMSDILYVLVYKLIGYRKEVVFNNLKLAFPHKSDQEIKTIANRFYHHFFDMFLEMSKTLSASKDTLKKRFVIKNPEELNRLESLDKSIILMYGHYASYEWSVVIENHITYKGYGVYKRIKNKYFDRLVKRIRSKYNTTLIHTKETIAVMEQLKAENIRIVIAFLSDQTPKVDKNSFWLDFMGVPVPCFTGAELLAKKLDHSVAFLKVKKVKRGYYEGEIVPLADDPQGFSNYDITVSYTRALEAQIYEAPEYYLWTHKRWKHRDKAPD